MNLRLLVGDLTRRLARGLMHLYYPKIEVSHRERIPAGGPILFVSNHPNSLLDPPVIGWAVEMPVHFFAKAPLFKVPVFGPVLDALGMVPAYRGSDDPSQVRRNLETLRAGAAFLGKGEAVGIFPEGKSHDLNRVEMIRTGAARMALQAVASGAAVIIVPVGLNHERKEQFRSAVWVLIGTPIDVAALLRKHGGQERPALRHVTAEIEQRLKEVVVHLDEPEWQPFLHELEILLPPRGAETAAPIARLRQRKLIADAMNYWLKTDRPRAEATAAAIQQHRAQLAEAHLSIESRILRIQGAALVWALFQDILKLLPGLIPSLVGSIHHLVPFALTRLLVRRKRQPGRAWLATMRLLWSLPIYAAWYVLVWWALAHWSKTWVAWAWVALMPLAGIIAWHHCHWVAATIRLWRQEARMLFYRETLQRLRRQQADLREKLLALAESHRGLLSNVR
jgi:glycerol-3-phosphate O-acyltransferase/dihydroxyacetone phosphate acyltransferase